MAESPTDAGYYERLFQGSLFPIIICGIDGGTLSWNVAAARLFCDGGSCLDGRRIVDIFPADSRLDVAEHLADCARLMRPVEFRSRLGGTDADPIEYAVVLTPVRDPDGALENFAAWFRDISPRIRLANALQKNERLTLLGTLSGAVAHHYNNLLCSIATSIEYAMNMSTMTAMRRALSRSSEAVTRGAAITRQLLAFARADHSAADLSDLTETVLLFFDEHEPRIKQRNITLDLDWQPIPFSAVLREPLRVVLHNIVENAVDVMPKGGTLTVHLAKRDDESACISIADSGPGITPADMERLFEPFHTTKGELGHGAAHNPGLGLAVAHGLIHSMNGAITASNIPGGGARFDIVLPLTRDKR